MSVGRPAIEQGSGGGIPPHDCEKDTDSEVYVNETRIPVADVDLHVRKEGPLDLSRYVEGEFASPFRDVDYIDVFDGLNPSQQDSFDTLSIEIQDHVTGDYHLAFNGVVTGVGNAPDSGGKVWMFRGQDPNLLLDKIPASANFRNTTAKDVLEYVQRELAKKVPFEVAMEVRDDEDVQQTTIGQSISAGVPQLGVIAKFTDLLSTPKTFQRNKHSLADVVDWLGEKTNTHVWLQPTEDGVGFVATDKPTAPTHTAHYLDGDGHEVKVVNNDAYVELKPVNTLVVKGSAAKSLGSVGSFDLTAPSGTFFKAKARHQPLYERAGERELRAEREELSDAMSVTEVENEARRVLKKNIDETTGGDMQTLLAPIRPFDVIEALPSCDGEVAPDLDPITYEVNRVHHKIKGSGLSETQLNVGVKSSLDDIEVIKSWEEEV
jgi:hypothetical protein